MTFNPAVILPTTEDRMPTEPRGESVPVYVCYYTAEGPMPLGDAEQRAAAVTADGERMAWLQADPDEGARVLSTWEDGARRSPKPEPAEPSPSTPVWHCLDDDCGGVVASGEQIDCPNCDGPMEDAGHTLGDVAAGTASLPGEVKR